MSRAVENELGIVFKKLTDDSRYVYYSLFTQGADHIIVFKRIQVDQQGEQEFYNREFISCKYYVP